MINSFICTWRNSLVQSTATCNNYRRMRSATDTDSLLRVTKATLRLVGRKSKVLVLHLYQNQTCKSALWKQTILYKKQTRARQLHQSHKCARQSHNCATLIHIRIRSFHNPNTENDALALFVNSRIINPYYHSVPKTGHRQTVQTQIRRRDQGLHCLLTGISVWNKIKMKKKVNQTPLNCSTLRKSIETEGWLS